MIWGMPTATFTFVHVLLSLVGIGAGCLVVLGLVAGRQLHGWTALFLAATVATSVTGFGFPVDHLLPSHAVGIISLVILAIASVARYGLHLAGAWRSVYIVCACVALYLNVFVAVVQAFSRLSVLEALAPKQTGHTDHCSGTIHSADHRRGEALPRRGGSSGAMIGQERRWHVLGTLAFDRYRTN